jgi:TPR repeat protein
MRALAIAVLLAGCSPPSSSPGEAEGRPAAAPAPAAPPAGAAETPPPAAAPEFDSVESAEAACRAGNAVACTVLGEHFGDAYGPEPDFARARQLLAPACEGGEQRACAMLGRLRARGQGGPAEPAEGAAMCRGACEAGEPRGCYQLALLHETVLPPADNERNATAIALDRRACDARLADACDELGQALVSGRGGAAADPAGAIRAYSAACDLGLPAACHKRAMVVERAR